MAYCSNCGKPLDGAGGFCPSCGSPVPEPAAGAAAVATPPPPPPLPGDPQGGMHQPGGAQPQHGGIYSLGSPAPRRRHSLKWLWIGGSAAVAVIAIACVLVFVVFRGGDGQEAATTETTVGDGVTSQTTISATSSTASTESTIQNVVRPEQAVLELFAALENQDVDALLALVDPTILAALPKSETWDAAKVAVAENLASMGSMKFSGIEMSTEMTSDSTATVTITAGTAAVTDAHGQMTSEDVKEVSPPVTVNLIRQDGKWYVESSPYL